MLGWIGASAPVGSAVTRPISPDSPTAPRLTAAGRSVP
jgi:hypothetical protein